MQIIIHILLINEYCVSHTEVFVSFLLNIVSFELYDPAEDLAKALNLEDNEPVNLLFESTGYERSDFVLNMGFMFLFMLAIPLILASILLCSYLCKCLPKFRACCRGQSDKTFFNRILMVLETSMMIVITCAVINIYQVQ